LEEPASAEFDEMKRAMRNKYADDDANIVDGPPMSVAATGIKVSVIALNNQTQRVPECMVLSATFLPLKSRLRVAWVI
jgi:hypothetical protein